MLYSKQEIEKIKKRKCPLCKGRLSTYKDYDGDTWLGCNKCEDWEILLSKIE